MPSPTPYTPITPAKLPAAATPNPAFVGVGMQPIYAKMTVDSQGAPRQVDDKSQIIGYMKDNGDGTYSNYTAAGVLEKTYTPSTGLGSFVDGLGSITNDTSGVFSNFVLPAAAMATGASLVNGGLASTAAPAAGGLLDTPIIDAAGNLVGGEVATGAVTSSPVYMGSTGGLLPIAAAGAVGAAAVPEAAAASTAAEPVAAAATAPASSVVAPVTATNPALIESAVGSGGYGASAAGGLLNGTGAAASIGGAMTASELLKLANDNKGLIGAGLGAIASSDTTTTSTTSDKSPWAPAQEWMKANLGLGQQLQKQYQANPFSQFQQQAYNNSAGLGNQFRGMVNGMTPQLNAFKPYQRTPQSQVATPYQFGTSNLGMTKNPFGG